MDTRALWEPDRPPSWEADFDALLKPSLVTAPPDHVQQAILAAVLQATAMPVVLPTAMPVAVPVAPSPLPWYPAPAGAQPTPMMPPGYAPEPAEVRPIPLAAYALLAAVLVTYVAAISWLNGIIGGGGWLTTLVAQLLAVADLLVGRPSRDEPLALAWQIVQQAPWLVLLPLGWALWERDRASSSVA
jgi:hypothetical protein